MRKPRPIDDQNLKTYSTKDSHVVTHRSIDLAIRSLTMGERTGSRIVFNLWPYMKVDRFVMITVARLSIDASINLECRGGSMEYSGLRNVNYSTSKPQE
ncbi:hypothetical protein BJ508DRAFT_340136 [Ascobolus immersus RN42]|uniref:Uncharacterized protein n=1 Tax=Ascobolus immersus RN42 TaxID=1160509 RepID=A0A3N4HMG3_ASCIM|nr:hypothetical protein BJ508DRAFT_340136 [Ascobolus immersus RN42]